MFEFPEVTYYSNLKKSDELNHINGGLALEGIKHGGDFIETIEKIRNLPVSEKTKINNLKMKLPGIGFAGTFSKRSNDSLIDASGLMCLDFDNVNILPEKLSPYVLAKFLSPSGTGLKALIKIPIVKNDKQYKEYFAAIEKEFPEVDGSGKDISRLTYMSWDPGILVNTNSIQWTKKIEASPPLSQGVHKVQSNYAKMSIGLKMVQQASVGNRHDSILKAGRLMGGYIAGGEVREEDVLKIFESEVLNQMDDPADFRAQWKTFTDGIGYGKGLPIKDREKERKSIKAEFRAEDVYGDLYYTAADMDEQLNDLYEHGNLRGVSTGWPTFDEYYSVAPGYFSLFYGNPFTGKTLVLFEMLINLSKLHGWRHLVFSPETGGPKDVYSLLIQIYAQGDVTNNFKNQMSRGKFDDAKKWVNDHFLVIDSEVEGVDFTLEDFLIYVQILERKFNIKFNTITGDPLIEFKFDSDVRDDIFWNRQIKIVRVQAKLNNWHIFLCTHTTKQTRVGIDDEGNSIFPIPEPGEIAGGQTFFRKGFQIVCVYRHTFEGLNGDSMVLKPVGNMLVYRNSTYLIVKKTKPMGIGKMGRVHFRLDMKTHHFTDPSGNAVVKQADLFPSAFTRLPYAEKDDLPDFKEPSGFMKIDRK